MYVQSFYPLCKDVYLIRTFISKQNSFKIFTFVFHFYYVCSYLCTIWLARILCNLRCKFLFQCYRCSIFPCAITRHSRLSAVFDYTQYLITMRFWWHEFYMNLIQRSVGYLWWYLYRSALVHIGWGVGDISRLSGNAKHSNPWHYQQSNSHICLLRAAQIFSKWRNSQLLNNLHMPTIRGSKSQFARDQQGLKIPERGVWSLAGTQWIRDITRCWIPLHRLYS